VSARLDTASWHALLWRAGYVVVVLLATSAEASAPQDVNVAERMGRALQPGLTGRDAVDAVRNVVLFAGWGAVWALTAGRRSWWATLTGAAATGLLLSAVVETAQLFVVQRTASVLDLLTNATGAALGAIGTLVLDASVRASRGMRSFVGMPMLVFAVAYGGATLMEAVMPVLRQDRLPVWGSPLARWRAAMEVAQPIRWAELPLVEFLLFAPAAAFVVAALVERGISYRVAAVITSVAGALTAVLAELARGLVGYVLSWGPMLLHGMALVGGAWAAAAVLPAATRALRGRYRPLLLLLGYVPLIALWTWRPFALESSWQRVLAKLEPGRLVPLYAYRERVDLFTAADALIPVLLFFPLGCLFAVWPIRARGLMRGVLPAIWLAVLMEVGQIAVAARFFDVTDIILQSAGAAMGWVLLRRAGYRPYGVVAAGMAGRARAAASSP
jgi:glycopeptide antibiotics resistance protein